MKRAVPDAPDLSLIGVWQDPVRFDVTRERLVAYARATNDATPARLAGDVASPVFAVVPSFLTAHQLIMSALTREVSMRSLHGEQDITFHRHLEPGMHVMTRSAIIGAAPTSIGMTITGRAISETLAGEPVFDQYVTVIVQGSTIPEVIGESVPMRPGQDAAEARPVESSAVEPLAPDQARRYSAAAEDLQPIHLDAAVAREAGFPDVILQGNCTFAIASQHVVAGACDGDSRRLRRLAVRYSSPVLLSETVTTHLRAGVQAGAQSAVAWESTLRDGTPCLKRGYALVDD